FHGKRISAANAPARHRAKEGTNLTKKWELSQLGQPGFHLVEVWQRACIVIALGILDHSGPIDDEYGAFGNSAHSQIHLRKERVIRNIICPGHLVLVITQ